MPPSLNRAQRRAASKPSGPQQRRLAVLKRLSRFEQSNRDKQEAEQRRARELPFSHPRNSPRVAQVFDPIEALLSDLCTTGDIDTMPDGTRLFRDPIDGDYCPLAPSLESMCETYTKLSRTFGWSDETDSLRRLAKRFELQMPVFQEDIDAARVTIAWMRERTMEITPAQFGAEAIEVQIRNAMQDITPDATP